MNNPDHKATPPRFNKQWNAYTNTTK
jgi:hypothetical protein